MDNLRFYNASRQAPAEALKAFNNGKFSGTDINPMWRIKKLTEMFGPAGIGWYTESLSERCEEHGDMTIAIVNINLYVKVDDVWSKPIFGTGGNVIRRTTKGGGESVSDEGYKMAYTDALSVACKALGIGANVYWDKDKTKYTTEEQENAAAEQKPAKAAKSPIKAAEKPAEQSICQVCKQPVPPIVGQDGEVRRTADQVIDFTVAKTGKCLCWNCYNNGIKRGSCNVGEA